MSTVKTLNKLEKLRYIIFALQTNHKNQKDKNVSNCDQSDKPNVKVFINSVEYTSCQLSTLFALLWAAHLYKICSRFAFWYHDVHIHIYPFLIKFAYQYHQTLLLVVYYYKLELPNIISYLKKWKTYINLLCRIDHKKFEIEAAI